MPANNPRGAISAPRAKVSSGSYRTCGFAGCNRHFYAKGFCDGHYRQKVQGRPLRPIRSHGGSLPKPVGPRILRKVLVNGKSYEEASDADRSVFCWVWQGSTNSNGYGQISRYGGVISTHRAVYEEFVGPIGVESVHHKCAVRRCVSPHHLSLATKLENAAEMFARKAYEQTIDFQQASVAEAQRKLDGVLHMLTSGGGSSVLVDDLARSINDVVLTLAKVSARVKPVCEPATGRKRARCRR